MTRRPHPLAAQLKINSHGFTLIELVVAMTITAIVIGFVAMFMTAPVDAYISQSERTVLNTSAEVISRRLADDLKIAIPNSVRISNIGTRSIVEMMQYDAVAIYVPVSPVIGRRLDTAALDTDFSTLGSLSATTLPPVGYIVGRLVIGNTGAGPNTDIYNPPANSFMTPSGANIKVTARSGTNEETVTLPAPFAFQSTDSLNRIFLLRGPVSYICNSAARTLRRYETYTAAATAPASEAAAQLNVAGVENLVLADNISACNLSCAIGPWPCSKVLVVEMSVNRPAPSGAEAIQIFEQFPVDNTT